MSKNLSRSPERNTFQPKTYLERMKEKGMTPDHEQLEIYQTYAQQREAMESDPAWQLDNLEYDLRSSDWMLAKVRSSVPYAQNLYAAMCNNSFQKLDVMPILTDKTWSCSWRSAGGIVADMRQEGDYIDWYCSGIRDDGLDGVYADGFVAESIVTDEIRDDLYQLGWRVIKDK
jgi:hypothetical protein